MDAETLAGSRLYSEELGIDLAADDGRERFEWFLASTLFGGRISQDIAVRTYRAFEDHDLLTPGAILDAGDRYLVDPVMQEGGYVRYDRQQSEQVVRNCERLLETYDGDPDRIHAAASDTADLEARLTEFHGVGPVTANIFLRELRPFWADCAPAPLDAVEEAAAEYGVDLDRFDRGSERFARVEAGLVRGETDR